MPCCSQVRKAACRLLGSALASPSVCKGLLGTSKTKIPAPAPTPKKEVQGGAQQGPGKRGTSSRAGRLAFSLFQQLESEGADEQTCKQAVKCLVPVAMQLHAELPPPTQPRPGSEQQAQPEGQQGPGIAAPKAAHQGSKVQNGGFHAAHAAQQGGAQGMVEEADGEAEDIEDEGAGDQGSQGQESEEEEEPGGVEDEEMQPGEGQGTPPEDQEAPLEDQEALDEVRMVHEQPGARKGIAALQNCKGGQEEASCTGCTLPPQCILPCMHPLAPLAHAILPAAVMQGVVSTCQSTTCTHAFLQALAFKYMCRGTMQGVTSSCQSSTGSVHSLCAASCDVWPAWLTVAGCALWSRGWQHCAGLQPCPHAWEVGWWLVERGDSAHTPRVTLSKGAAG